METEETVTPTSEEATEEVETTEESTEEEVDWKALAEKNAELANNYKTRAEKAEKKAKEAPKQQHSSLPQSDIIYLAKADIDDEDISEITTYAEKMGVSVKEAHEFLKPILDVRQEQRRTAQTTEVKSGRGKTQKTGEDYLETALKTGELPDSDEAMQALILAKQKRKD